MMASINVNIPDYVRKELEEMIDQMQNAVLKRIKTIGTGLNRGIPTLPTHFEDAEKKDIDAISRLIDLYFENTYPEFEPEIVHAQYKDYFLPALKILDWDGQDFYSPQRKTRWGGNELDAKCVRYNEGWNGMGYQIIAHKKYNHSIKDCDCGIYGSVNLEEIQDYCITTVSGAFIPMDNDPIPERIIEKKLVLIEPSPNADIILCRKGWKASHAFISEIVGETISIEDTSRLLSIAWHREIDVQELFK